MGGAELGWGKDIEGVEVDGWGEGDREGEGEETGPGSIFCDGIGKLTHWWWVANVGEVDTMDVNGKMDSSKTTWREV